MTVHSPRTAAWLVSRWERRCANCGRPFVPLQDCRIGGHCEEDR